MSCSPSRWTANNPALLKRIPKRKTLERPGSAGRMIGQKVDPSGFSPARTGTRRRTPMVIAEPVDTQLVILEPNGRLTAETVDEFNQVVSKWVRRGWHDVILDLQHVTYLDSAG